MIVTATQKNIPVTPKKMRFLVNAIKDLDPQEAVVKLGYLNHSAAPHIQKTIKQAIANAVNNFKLQPDKLQFNQLSVNQASMRYAKRWRAAARGRAKPYTKRSSHLIVKLETPQKATTPKSQKPRQTTLKKQPPKPNLAELAKTKTKPSAGKKAPKVQPKPASKQPQTQTRLPDQKSKGE